MTVGKYNMLTHKYGQILLASLLLASSNAYAYIDPGTGSILIQGIIATIAAVAVTMRLYWYRIKAFFGLGKDKSNETESSTSASDAEDSNSAT